MTTFEVARQLVRDVLERAYLTPPPTDGTAELFASEEARLGTAQILFDLNIDQPESGAGEPDTSPTSPEELAMMMLRVTLGPVDPLARFESCDRVFDPASLEDGRCPFESNGGCPFESICKRWQDRQDDENVGDQSGLTDAVGRSTKPESVRRQSFVHVGSCSHLLESPIRFHIESFEIGMDGITVSGWCHRCQQMTPGRLELFRPEDYL